MSRNSRVLTALTAAAAAALLGACASTSSSTSGSTGSATSSGATSPAATVGATTTSVSTAPVQQSVSGFGAGTNMTLVNEAATSRTTVALPIAEAWTRLQAAYTKLGIKVTKLDQQSYYIGNPGLRARRKIGDVKLVDALNCGMSGTAPNAESYELTLDFHSQLLPSAGGVIIETHVNGTGKNVLTNASSSVPCYSMGALDKRIVELVSTGK
ncbi:MAG: hypothetical protein ACO1Q7_19780 [Gemmatimonas sp.]